jgi:hypothetical protein
MHLHGHGGPTVGPVEKNLQEEFDRGLRGLPWVLDLVSGSTQDISDVSGPEFMNGLILLIAVVHRNTLRLAREIDNNA